VEDLFAALRAQQERAMGQWRWAGQTFAGDVNLWKSNMTLKSSYTASVFCTEIHRVKNEEERKNGTQY